MPQTSPRNPVLIVTVCLLVVFAFTSGYLLTLRNSPSNDVPPAAPAAASVPAISPDAAAGAPLAPEVPTQRGKATVPQAAEAPLVPPGRGAVVARDPGASFDLIIRPNDAGVLSLVIAIKASFLLQGTAPPGFAAASPLFRNIEIQTERALTLNQPFILLSADATALDAGGKAIALITRITVTATPTSTQPGAVTPAPADAAGRPGRVTTLYTFDATIYDLRVSPGEISRLDPEALTKAAANRDEFEKILAALGTARPLYRVHQSANSNEEQFLKVTNETPGK